MKTQTKVEPDASAPRGGVQPVCSLNLGGRLPASGQSASHQVPKACQAPYPDQGRNLPPKAPQSVSPPAPTSEAKASVPEPMARAPPMCLDTSQKPLTPRMCQEPCEKSNETPLKTASTFVAPDHDMGAGMGASPAKALPTPKSTPIRSPCYKKVRGSEDPDTSSRKQLVYDDAQAPCFNFLG